MPPRRKPTTEEERILMVDFASTQTQAEEVAPPASCEEGHAEAAMAKPLSASPLLTADGVDKMYYQLAEIHAIAATQLIECACWRRSDSTPSSVRAETNWLRPITMPSTIRLAPSPLLISRPRPCYGGRVGAASPKLTRVARARYPSAARRARDRADMVTSSGTHLRSRVASPHSTPLATRRSCFALPREAGR
jgi:hypothetical protein